MARTADGYSYPPRGMRAPRAAAYLDMSESSFLALVEDGIMPPAIKVKGMVIWDRHALDVAFDNLNKPGPRNTIDALLGIPEKPGRT
jgi:hypothetical protein